jgi:hypothetical protein
VLGVTSDAMNAILEVYAARLPATR